MTTKRNLPVLFSDQIADRYARENFRRISEYLSVEMIFAGFRFFTVEFTRAETHFKLTHNLGFLPQDIVLTSKTGVGSVTFNYDLTDAESIDITTTGACTVRFLAGSFMERAR